MAGKENLPESQFLGVWGEWEWAMAAWEEAVKRASAQELGGQGVSYASTSGYLSFWGKWVCWQEFDIHSASVAEKQTRLFTV